MEISDLPSRDPEGWAVVDLMGRRRLVGRVQVVCVAGVAMLEVDQPEIRVAQYPHAPGTGVDPDGVVLSAHKLIVHPQAVYTLTPVPDEAHCVNAFFETNTVFDLAEGPTRWSPEAQAAPEADEEDDDYPDGPGSV